MSALDRYLRAREKFLGSGLREPAPACLPGELALQAAFFAGEFGLSWEGLGGERIEAVHFGAWNREPGPDFVGAKLRIDGRTIEGDIELDRENLDWERHGHAANRAFDDVVLHVFFRAGRRRFFTRTSRNTEVVQVLLEASRTGGRRGPLPPPPSAGSDPAALGILFDAAARFRMARKRERWLKAEALHGRREALFQALAAGLGYKNNSVPFLLLAQRVGLDRAAGAGGEGLLFGIAGFLDARGFDGGTPAMRGYARGLWDAWWAVRAREARLQLPVSAWTFGPVRPANHPHRRTGALAALATHFPSIQKAMEKSSPRDLLDALGRLTHPFWDAHASLGGRPLAARCALIGAQRAADLAANVYCPSQGVDDALAALREIPGGSLSGKARRAVEWLGVPRDFAGRGSAFFEQALLQVYEDFHPAPPEEILELAL